MVRIVVETQKDGLGSQFGSCVFQAKRLLSWRYECMSVVDHRENQESAEGV